MLIFNILDLFHNFYLQSYYFSWTIVLSLLPENIN